MAPAVVRAGSLMGVVYRPHALIVFRHTLYGDGVHDDTRALQAFFNGLEVIEYRTGLPARSKIHGGSYLISGTINMDNNRTDKMLYGCRVIGDMGHG